jgi:DNA helicase II / ATP-dependent DNA helicase PcrA
MIHTPSKYQQDIFNFSKINSENALVNAVAGSGKTTTIIECSNTITNADVVFLAFNRSVVGELRKRVNDNIDVSTLHSLGMSVMRKAFKHTKVVEKKISNLIYPLQKQFKVDDKEFGGFMYRIQNMVNFIRLNNVKTTKFDDIVDLGLRYDLLLNEREYEAIKLVLQRSDSLIAKEIDFTDMLYQPVRLGLELPKYDFVFIDEVQDLSIIQQLLFQKTLKRNGRFIAVGDPYQAIYSFAGADSDSFNKIKQIPNTVELPLSVCYRCDRTIVEYARKIVTHIEVKEGVEQGFVRNSISDEIKPGDMVLCRNNKPLVKMCLKFFREKRKASIRGLEFGNELISMIKQTGHTNKVVSAVKLDKNLDTQFNRLKSFGVVKPEKTNLYRNTLEKIQIIKDDVFPEVNDTKEAITLIEHIFNERNEQNKIMLSTIHKAKGLEADRVHIACKQLMPSKFANTEEEKLQERNLEYVAYTRAKHGLMFLTDIEE